MLQQYTLSFTFILSLSLSLPLSLFISLLLPLFLSRQNRFHNDKVASNDHRDVHVWRMDNSIDLSMASSPDSAI